MHWLWGVHCEWHTGEINYRAALAEAITHLSALTCAGTQLRGAHDPKLGYFLRAFTVFSYCHYKVFIYLEHVGWVQCDGPTMRVVGGWVDVVNMCVDGGSQPVDAFYTAVSCASTPTSSVGAPPSSMLSAALQRLSQRSSNSSRSKRSRSP